MPAKGDFLPWPLVKFPMLISGLSCFRGGRFPACGVFSGDFLFHPDWDFPGSASLAELFGFLGATRGYLSQFVFFFDVLFNNPKWLLDITECVFEPSRSRPASLRGQD